MVHTPPSCRAEGTKENSFDLSSLETRKRPLSAEHSSRRVRQKSLVTTPRVAVAALATTGSAAYCDFHRLFEIRGSDLSEKDALAEFEHIEAYGRRPSTNRAELWLKGALSCKFENLGERIVTSDIIKDITLQRILQFVAQKSEKVFEILLVRENARGLLDQVTFASNLSSCLDVVCTYDRPYALVASILSIIGKAWTDHHNGISASIFNVRSALMRACSSEKTLIVLQLIDVPFWKNLDASYVAVFGTMSLRKKLDSLQLSDELKTRLEYLDLIDRK